MTYLLTYQYYLRIIVISLSPALAMVTYSLKKQSYVCIMFMLRPEYVIRTIYISLAKLNYDSTIVTFYEFVCKLIYQFIPVALLLYLGILPFFSLLKPYVDSFETLG